MASRPVTSSGEQIARGLKCRRLVLSHPFPVDGTKVTHHRRINECSRPQATQKTYRSHPGDVRLLRYVILFRPGPPGNDGSFAFLTWKGHEMKIVGGAFCGIQKGSSPSPWQRA